jgi:diaminohydroxyphosphoribosylaminopyrimidine deaminase/5-amino-6-(5-phosphoribosylamino)uracil reductase
MERHDERHMREALQLALRGWGNVSPRPLVGALVVHDDVVIGRGWFEGSTGSPHAEVRALSEAAERATGATVICTLEPCDHHGSTPPCTEALIEAGIRRVVVATTDPNPIVDGRGIQRLRTAGIEVRLGVLESHARRLNEAFEKHVRTGIPFVTVKAAASMDGKAAASDGTSKWITGQEARADVQRLRAGADAVVVGAGTAIADDPALTVRDPRFAQSRHPLRVLVDSAGRVGPGGRLFDGSAPTVVATTDRARGDQIERWQDAGAEVIVTDADADGRVSVGELAATLGKRDVQALLVEGGPTLAWSFVRDEVVDKLVLYLAPILVGGGRAPGTLMGEGFRSIGEARAIEFASVERIGSDLRLEAYVHRDR